MKKDRNINLLKSIGNTLVVIGGSFVVLLAFQTSTFFKTTSIHLKQNLPQGELISREVANLALSQLAERLHDYTQLYIYASLMIILGIILVSKSNTRDRLA
ncbi:hypothetical protein ACFPK9_00740 [Rubritalea spongiae]|uniref:Reverse transcriptase domain-containing protein n=1 Tax=Rubritalea spongiae TaxID=430797 RepID=A0ABW5E3Y5_9BACT